MVFFKKKNWVSWFSSLFFLSGYTISQADLWIWRVDPGELKCYILDFLHPFSRYVENSQCNFFIYVPLKFVPKFQRSLPYTSRFQVIKKIILHFQFHFTTLSNHPGSQSNSSSSTQHILFNNTIQFKFIK